MRYKKVVTITQFMLAVSFLAGLIAGFSIIQDQQYLKYHLYKSALNSIIFYIDKFSLCVLASALLIALLQLISNSMKGFLKSFFRVISYSIVIIYAILMVLKGTYIELFLKDFFSGEMIKILLTDFLLPIMGALFCVIAGIAFILRFCSKNSTGTLPEQEPKIESSRIFLLQLIARVFIGASVFLNLIFGGLLIANAVTINKKPNVVFIMVDSLRADHLKAYGYKYDTSPNIDKLAEDSIRFEQAISQASWTTASVGSFMTSHPQGNLGIGGTTFPLQLKNSFLTLAEIMKDQGYKTASISSNALAGSRVNLNQGFDFWNESAFYKNFSSPVIYSKSINWIKENKKNKFFLFMLFLDPHLPYFEHKGFEVPSKLEKTIGKDPFRPTLTARRLQTSDREIKASLPKYDSEIKYTDFYIGKLINYLKRQGLYEDTLIIFLADHGDEFLDHGNYSHGRTLFNELIHVPLIIKLPKQKQGRVVKGLFPLMDVTPSIMGVLNNNPSKYSFAGEDANLASIRESKNKTITFGTDYENTSLRGMISNHYKCIIDRTSFNSQLYNIESDPGENDNLIIKMPKRTAEMRKTIEELNKNSNSIVGSSMILDESKKPNKKEKERLKSLGYLQ